MSGRRMRRELRRMRERIGLAKEPEAAEAWERAYGALVTLENLLHAHGEVIDREYRERVGRGENHMTALVGAKRRVWQSTKAGRAALEVLGGTKHLQEEGGGDEFMSVCCATKRDGEPCTLSATDGNGFCWAHSPRHASERKRIASRGGRGKGGGELPELRRQLKDLAAGVLDGTVDRGRAAVANQLYNTLIRAIEQERRVRETEELAREVEEMRELLESRKESRYG